MVGPVTPKFWLDTQIIWSMCEHYLSTNLRSMRKVWCKRSCWYCILSFLLWLTSWELNSQFHRLYWRVFSSVFHMNHQYIQYIDHSTVEQKEFCPWIIIEMCKKKKDVTCQFLDSWKQTTHILSIGSLLTSICTWVTHLQS